MTSALRLASLSYAIARVDASLLFWSGNHDAGNWGPARDTVGAAELDPVGWTPKPTAPPGAKPLDHDLRRRQQTTTEINTATCGYAIDNSSAPAISCSDGAYCFQARGVAGCCSEANRRNCRIPTACVESIRSSSYTSNSETLLCTDTAQPRCVTYLYNADFFGNLYGVSFLACGEEAGSSTIATSPPPGWTPTSTTPGSLSTSSDPTGPVTITVFPSSTPSSSTTPAAAAATSNNSSRTGKIVGGVIGGVAGLALIIAALFFLLRYRRRKAAEGKQFEGSPYPTRDYPAASVYPGGIPEPQYTSDFYGELPPQMSQASTQHDHVSGYPPPPPPATTYHEPIVIPREPQPQARPTTFVHVSPKPNDDDIVSPITPGDGLNPADDPSTYTWISNPTPPPQSEYSPFSPPPPAHFQSYRPYPGT
ncbi:hypothetical protein F4776DRAFT_346868 [Hypoxylon sp. NC0597]|nr:hypothetical protein F4776DRAFT_346868 [Hypoxylon sp. NC0597]